MKGLAHHKGVVVIDRWLGASSNAFEAPVTSSSFLELQISEARPIYAVEARSRCLIVPNPYSSFCSDIVAYSVVNVRLRLISLVHGK